MFIKRSKLFLAGVMAVLIGLPLAQETFASGTSSLIGGILDTSLAGSDLST